MIMVLVGTGLGTTDTDGQAVSDGTLLAADDDDSPVESTAGPAALDLTMVMGVTATGTGIVESLVLLSDPV
jgi:hypothetical protein